MFKGLMERLRNRARKQQEREREELDAVEEVDPSTGEITIRDRRDEDDEPVEHEIEDDRGPSLVNRALSLQSKIVSYGVMLVVGAVVLFVLAKYYVELYRKKAEEAAQTTQTNTRAPTGNATPPYPKVDDSYGLSAPEVPPPQAGGAGAAAQAQAGATQRGSGNSGQEPQQQQFDRDGKPVLTPEQLIEQRRRNSKVALKIEGNTAQAAPAVGYGAVPVSAGGVGSKIEGYSEELKPSYLPGVKAQVIPDRNLFITRGRNLGCLIEEAIQTSVPGSLTCTLTSDVSGSSGNVVLLDRGTILTGTYKADVKGKDSRLFVLWERAETPTGVIVELASPTGDGLGRAGIELAVDTHFMERFSAGMLVSVVGDAAAVLQARSLSVQGNNNAFAFPNTTQGAQSLATEAIKQNSGIPNTGVANQARYVNVYVARDLDFRGVYKLEPTSKRR